MKIVTWNCNGAFRRKYERIAAYDADIYVIQECEDPAHSTADYREWAGTYLWTGKIASKGLGVFVKNELSLAALDWPDHGLQQFLPVRIADRFNLLAVWTKRGEAGNMPYIGQFWQYLQHHSAKLTEETIICGDFNSNAIWDKPRRMWNHSECIKLLMQRGFHSNYHAFISENQGNESQPTLYLQRNTAKPYHVDYIFTHEGHNGCIPYSLIVGKAEEWLLFSDHMPIISEFN